MPNARPTPAPLLFGTALTPQDAPFAELAGHLARRLGTTLTLVNVSDPARGAELEAEARRLSAHCALEVRAHAATGPLAAGLASRADFELGRALLLGPGAGALTEQVSRLARVPVWSLRAPAPLEAWLRGERTLRVLVGADFGRTSEAARAFAAFLAEAGLVSLEVLHVADPAEVHERLHVRPLSDPRELAPDAEAALSGALARTAPPAERDATLRVVAAQDAVAPQLCRRADEAPFDLLVVGRRHRSLLEQLWPGSVARAVLRDARCSVAAVPPEAAPPPPAWQAPKVVLAAVDFTPASQRALTAAAGLVAEGGAVHLAHVLPVVLASPEGARQARVAAWTALARAPLDVDRGAQVTRHLLEGDTAEQLLALAARVGAELLVAGAGGRAFSLGSVALGLSARAQVPVLLVPTGAP